MVESLSQNEINIEVPLDRRVLDVDIKFSNKGEKASLVNEGNGVCLKINVSKFENSEAAIGLATREAVYLSTRKELVSQNNDIPESDYLRRVLQLKGLKRLQATQIEEAEELADLKPSYLTYAKQFDYACEYYLLKGVLPEGIDSSVSEAFAGLNMKGKNVLKVMTEGNRTIESTLELFEKYVLPLRKEIQNSDEELKETEGDTYTPPPFGGDLEKMDPEEARFKVTPFIGGYYREGVFRYDDTNYQLVAKSTVKTKFVPQDLPESLDEFKVYTFQGQWPGSFQAGKETLLPLPYTATKQALPLPVTLEPAGKFEIMRDTFGCFSLVPIEGAVIEDGVEFSFKFIMCKNEDTVLNDDPIEADSQIYELKIDEESQEMLEQIRANVFLKPIDKARALVSRTKQRFDYPKEEEMPEMNAKYMAAKKDVLLAMREHGKADCHWSNNSAMILGHELELSWRVAHGYYLSKHPDVNFAPVGGIGHEWSEVWDESKGEWIKLDATPPQKNDKEDENNEESEADNPGEDGDEDQDSSEGDVEESGLVDLSEEELDNLLNLDEELVEDGIEKIAEAVFKARTKVDKKAWTKVKGFIDMVNSIKIPQNEQLSENDGVNRFIRAEKGTLEREWQKLFALIVKRRRIKQRAFKGPRPNSEGDYVDDFVSSYIGLLSGDDDPVDSKVEATKIREILDVAEFEEDSIIDLTSSMEATDNYGNVMRVEQKKLILSLLYQLMKLNSSLNDSRIKSKLSNPLEIKSSVASIHGAEENGSGLWSILKTSKESITEEVLVNLARELDETSPGSGDLLSALRTYREGISEKTEKRLKAGKLVKMLTIYSDGNMYCKACGHEGCNVRMHREAIQSTQDEVRKLREMGVIVQGIGFTQKAEAIKTICWDTEDPDSAVVIDDVKQAVMIRQKMLVKHLKKM